VATITGVWTQPVGGISRVIFTPMTFTGTDVSTEIEAPDFAHKEVQVFGTFGAGGNVAIEGSLDGGTTWAVLNDVSSTALNVTSAKIEKIQETCARIRARVTAGDGSTTVTVVFVLKSGGTYGS